MAPPPRQPPAPPPVPQPGALLSWMASLGDTTRLRLLRLLEGHELGVVDLCDILQLPQSTVSRHLKVLLAERWVTARREARTHLYRMDPVSPAEGAKQLWQLSRTQIADWATVGQDESRLQGRLAERASRTQAFFAGAAGEWDKLRGELFGQAPSLAAMLSLLDPSSVVADLGCGTGQLAAGLAPYVRQVIAVDGSPAMLEAAKRRLGETANVSLRAGELARLPIQDGACDAAMLMLVLGYLSEIDGVLGELARILKPGGRVVIVDLLPHDREEVARRLDQRVMGFDPRALVARLESRGFAGAMARPIPPESDVGGPGLFVLTARRG